MKNLAIFLLSGLIIFASFNLFLASKGQCLLNEPEPQKAGEYWGGVYLEHAYNPFSTGTRKVCLQHAVDAYSNAIKANPTYTGAWMNRAGAFVGLHQYENAIQDYLTVYAQTPAYVPVLEDLYSTYKRMEETDKSAEILQILVSTLENPDSFWASFYPNKITKYRKLLAEVQP